MTALAPESKRTPWYRSFRFWISAVTAVLVGVIIWSAWPQVVEAFHSLDQVNPWILALLVPVQLLSFAATGEVLFSFLRARGELRGTHPLAAVRMSLEFNFANHMLPSGGAAGIAYTSWKLSTLGVPASRGTLAQLAKFAVTFVSFIIMLVASVCVLLAGGNGVDSVLWIAAAIGILAILAIVAGLVLLRRRRLLHRFAGVLVRLSRFAARIVRKPIDLQPATVVRFFDGLYRELRAITEKPRALLAPFLWSFLVNGLDAGLFLVALAAFDIYANPALIFVAYGVATVASMVIVTPNGVGAYEVVMLATLVAGGLTSPTVIAAIVVARVILLLGTILFGYAFYQHSVMTASAPALRR